MMSVHIIQGPPEEQQICVDCGFCCDGTIFECASLKPGERGNIPVKMVTGTVPEKGEEYFHLPCPYFNKKCTIYDLKRAEVCGTFRCQLLKKFAAGELSPDQAINVISVAAGMRMEIKIKFQRLTGRSEAISFRQMIRELGKIVKAEKNGQSFREEIELLIVRCNIFEALLIKHFRSEDDFEKLVMK